MKVIVILTCLILFSCNSGKEQKKNINHSKYESLQLRLDSLYESHFDANGPGVALLIAYNSEKIVSKGYGMRDLETQDPITPSTNMRSGSMAKQFTALGILSLMEQGKLALTDTIYKYFPYPTFKNVTIKQFISHTSGLEDGEWIVQDEWHSPDYARNEDILDWYAENEVIRFPPGTAFEYNNGTYDILAQIIEKVSGMAYEDYIQKHVFNKAGMINTQFIDDADSSSIPEYAYRYEKDSLGQWHSVEGHFMDEEVGAGGIYLSLNDYFTYLEAIRKKTILKPETHEYIFNPISMNIELHSQDLSILKNKNSSYAMGWEVTDSLALSAGLWNGNNNFVIFERKRPLTIVMLANNRQLFKHRLVDKTYAIVEEYFNKAANN